MSGEGKKEVAGKTEVIELMRERERGGFTVPFHVPPKYVEAIGKLLNLRKKMAGIKVTEVNPESVKGYLEDAFIERQEPILLEEAIHLIDHILDGETVREKEEEG